MPPLMIQNNSILERAAQIIKDNMPYTNLKKKNPKFQSGLNSDV